MHLFLKRKKYLCCLIILSIFLFGNLSLNNFKTNNNDNNELVSNYETLLEDESNDYFIKQIETGARHSGAIVTNNGVDELYTWGWNEDGQLGYSPTIENHSPNFYKVQFPPEAKDATIEEISFGYSHSGAVLNYDGGDHLYMWGSNNHGELGVDPANPYSTKNYNPTEVIIDDIPDGAEIKQISMGYYSSNVVFDNLENSGSDQLYSWGHEWGTDTSRNIIDSPNFPDNNDILPTEVNFPIGNDLEIQQISTNTSGLYGYSTAIVNNDLYSWGTNDKGQLGLGQSNADQEEPTRISFFDDKIIKQIATGGGHSAAVTEENGSDKLYTWGLNDYGQLGLGNDDNYNTPQEVTSLPKGNIEQISLGLDFSSLIVNDKGTNKLYTWGNNSVGQLGLGDGSGEPYNTPQLVSSLDCNVNQVSLGRKFGLALTNNELEQIVYSWGNNSKNQLGPIEDPETRNQISPEEIWSSSYTAPTIDLDMQTGFQLDSSNTNDYDEVKISYLFTSNIKIEDDDYIIIELFSKNGDNLVQIEEPKKSYPQISKTNPDLYFGEVTFPTELGKKYQYKITTSFTNEEDFTIENEFLNSKDTAPKFKNIEEKEVKSTSAIIEFTYSYQNSSYADLNKIIIRDQENNLEQVFSDEEIIYVENESEKEKTGSVKLVNLTPNFSYNIELEGWFFDEQVQAEQKNFQIVVCSEKSNFKTESVFKEWFNDNWYYFLITILVLIFIFFFNLILVLKQRRKINR